VRKYIVFILISALYSSALAQTGQKVELISSQLSKGFTSKGLIRIIKPVFSHDGSTLAADSANFDQKRNVFDAFGNIVITQPNGTTVYSDLLNYNGNTKLAVLTRNVRLVDGDAILTTGLLTYNMGTKIGTYLGGGKIINGQNVLTSKRGYYFANTRDAYFRNEVVLTSPDAIIKSDTLRYNTTSKIAYFYGPTNIYGKDDTLYTENGEYNTVNDQARFGKKNLYTQGKKSLKGDSLFYDRRRGFGRALGNITFVDAAENITFKGDIGLYRKEDESILATRNAYVIITTESDSAKVDSIYMTADTLFSKVVPDRQIKPSGKEKLKSDKDIKAEEAIAAKKESKAEVKEDTPAADNEAPVPKATKPGRKERKAAKNKPQAPDTLASVKPAPEVITPPDSGAVKKTVTDTVEVKLTTDSVVKKPSKKAARKAALKGPAPKTVMPLKDSLPADTARTRIVMAYHHSKIFKSDLQARSDSMFFSYGDSIVRCYVKPMIWTQGSQLSGDTVYLQLKNKKLDNMLLQHNSFIVNTEEGDSTHFNQVKGKVITGVFADGKLDRMFVDGNAESIYYVKEDSVYSGMNRMLSSRIKVIFKENKLKDIISILKPEGNYYPIEEIPKDEEILKGFIWKPKDRPRSKEEIIPSLAAKKKPVRKTPAKKPAPKVVPVAKKTT
jgi:lipopolysaccharide export system protein LptA